MRPYAATSSANGESAANFKKGSHTLSHTRTIRNASRHASTFAAGAIVISIAAFNPVAAFAGEVNDSPAVALSEFRENLVTNGDAAEVSAFDALSVDQRSALAGYFFGNGMSPDSPTTDAIAESHGDTTTYTDGDFAWAIEDEEKSASAAATSRAAAATRNISGNQWFSFAGIKISETKVSLSYQAIGKKATKVNSYSCVVVKNADPLAQISSSKSNAYIAGDNATAKCKVVVKRGVPSPWGQITWSTKEGIQVLAGNGGGKVVKNTWE